MKKTVQPQPLTGVEKEALRHGVAALRKAVAMAGADAPDGRAWRSLLAARACLLDQFPELLEPLRDVVEAGRLVEQPVAAAG